MRKKVGRPVPEEKNDQKNARNESLFPLTSLGAWSEARVISFLRGGPLGRGGPLMTILSPESTAETTPVREEKREREE